MIWVGAAGPFCSIQCQLGSLTQRHSAGLNAFAHMSGASDGMAGMAGDACWVSLHMVSTSSLFFEWLDPKRVKMGSSKILRV